MSAPPSVLIVDDDPALLDALPAAVRLRLPGTLVDVADSADAALEKIVQTDYEVIITDIKMPGMDGLSLLGEIRKLRPETPTVLISGHGEHDLTIQALRGGAYDYIQKPLDRDYFMAALERAFQTRALRRQVATQRAELEQHAATLEATVAERTRELQVASEAKDEFLGMISHEMRTPLTLIAGGIHVLRLREAELDLESRAAIMRDVESETSRLTRIVEDLLVLAHTHLGDITSAEPVSLHAVVQRVMDAACRRTQRQFIIEVEPDLPALAAAETYVERVLANLVSNADKYSQPNTAIRIVANSRSNDLIELRVVDSGPGVGDDEIELIFDRFFRSRSNAAVVPGVGMGLTVCKRLIEAMSGQIWAGRVVEGFEVGFALPAYPGWLLEGATTGPSAEAVTSLT